MTSREETYGTPGPCPRAIEVRVPGLRVKERGGGGLEPKARSSADPSAGEWFPGGALPRGPELGAEVQRIQRRTRASAREV